MHSLFHEVLEHHSGCTVHDALGRTRGAAGEQNEAGVIEGQRFRMEVLLPVHP